MSIFDKKPSVHFNDFSSLGADLHSHLLPGIDDGSRSTADSIEMIKKMKSLGYNHLITTPHINSDMFDNTEEAIRESHRELLASLKEKQVEISLKVAAEYYMNIDFLDKLGQKKLLTFGKNYILLEFSFHNPPVNLEQLIFQIQAEGYNIILAHPERYGYWHNNTAPLKNLSDRGVFMQVNIGSFSGSYNIATQKMAEKMAQNQLIDFLGSDLHQPHQIQALDQALINKHLQVLLASNTLKNTSLLNSGK